MSVCKLSNGKFLLIDTIKLTPEVMEALNSLTDFGKNIDSVIATHPYHTLAFRDFYRAFPKIHRGYYGTPRHLDTIKDIPWAGEVMANKGIWEPDVEMRIPAGCEYILPLPPTSNHFCNVFVFHKASRTIHNDDCIIVSHDPGFLMRMLGFSEGSMWFHLSMSGPGLNPTPEAPGEFRDWVLAMCEDWDFVNICTAHNGNSLGNAKQQLLETLKKAEPTLKKLEEANRKKEPKKECGSWSNDPNDPPDCG
eukprot:CAMPEP_0181303460 /NCGR_PEP_ID=MMETSP1101-20121128/8570_1 /TAXON_ID=46948 /ORGANISM="Rhodomonas abbreviata, Strain Caron Lab Isolate" /LENGTH=249 /DNA_ID=CAMNT_0023409035 /DNA_START=219 /DNA_END=968 /DNA_ORIENTATION=-